MPPFDAGGTSLEHDRLALIVLWEMTLPAGPPATGSVPDAWLLDTDTDLATWLPAARRPPLLDWRLTVPPMVLPAQPPAPAPPSRTNPWCR